MIKNKKKQKKNELWRKRRRRPISTSANFDFGQLVELTKVEHPHSQQGFLSQQKVLSRKMFSQPCLSSLSAGSFFSFNQLPPDVLSQGFSFKFSQSCHSQVVSKILKKTQWFSIVQKFSKVQKNSLSFTCFGILLRIFVCFWF